jgi:hypothetical protein
MMGKKWLQIGLAIFLVVGSLSGSGWAAAEKQIPKVGPVKLNAHLPTLEGKTVLLRWNGKYNGDKFLARLGELLTQQVKNVKILKLWEMDSTTVAISKNGEASEEVANKIARLKPDLVIAAQAD